MLGSRSLRSLGISPPVPHPDRPSSPTFSETTNVSTINLTNGPDRVISRANLRQSMQAYDELLHSSANYCASLMAMSKATAAFASAMDACSSLKGCSYQSASRLQAASGLHHLMANQWHVLGDTIEKKFEKPLRQHLDGYKAVVTERSTSYERVLREKSTFIHRIEQQNLGRKGRNLQTFREALATLQQQVDELDRLKAEHYQEVLEHEEGVWDSVQGKVSLVVRSSLDVFDRFTAKASDPVIEPMLQSIPDPFDAYGPPKAEDQIFSILAPLSLASNSATPTPSTPETECGVLPSSTPPSWLDNPNGVFTTSSSTEWAGVASLSPPRSHSPSGSNSHHPQPPMSNHSTIRKSDAVRIPQALSSTTYLPPPVSDTPLDAESTPGNSPRLTIGPSSHSRASWNHFIGMPSAPDENQSSDEDLVPQQASVIMDPATPQSQSLLDLPPEDDREPHRVELPLPS